MVSFISTHLSHDVFGPEYVDPVDPVENTPIRHPVVLCSREEELAVIMQITMCRTILSKGNPEWLRRDGSVDKRGFLEKFYTVVPTKLAGKWSPYTEKIQRAAERIFLTDSGFISLKNLRVYEKETLEVESVLKSCQRDDDVAIIEHTPLHYKLWGVPIKKNPDISFADSDWVPLSPIKRGTTLKPQSIRSNPLYQIIKFLLDTYMNVFHAVLNLISG